MCFRDCQIVFLHMCLEKSTETMQLPSNQLGYSLGYIPKHVTLKRL